MKTVPSGKLLVCMNGAFERLGTVTVTGCTAPDNVGRPVSAASLVALVPMMVGMDPEDDAVDPEPVIVMALADVLPLVDAPLVLPPVVAEAVFDADPVPVAALAVERLGRVDAAEAANAKVTATAVDRWKSLMVFVRTRDVKRKISAARKSLGSRMLVVAIRSRLGGSRESSIEVKVISRDSTQLGRVR